MTSERKAAANRINSRKSRGPRTAAGKSRASRNALRHGLSTITRHNPAMSPDIEIVARAICADDTNPLLFDQALIIAESAMALRCVRTERVGLIERLRDGTAIPVARGDNSVALMEARSKRGRLAHQEHMRLIAIIDDGKKLPAYQTLGYEEFMRLLFRLYADKLEEVYQSDGHELAWENRSIQERDEFDAMRVAMPDLDRLERYDRRAWSHLKRAVDNFIKIKIGSGEYEHDTRTAEH